jgi:UPF0271 protein
MMRIDLNCDLGEGMPEDEAILPSVTSASVACGFHAGGPALMRRTVAAAAASGVAVGAHPSYPDREGFGRHAMELPPVEIHDVVLYQVGALEIFVRQAGLRLQHLKPHGALYHAADRRPEVAEAIVRAARAAGGDLVIVGPPGSQLAAVAARQGLRFAAEVFADRHYGEDGRLLPRAHPAALVEGGDEVVAARAVAMVQEGAIRTVGGTVIPAAGHTLCLHGDHPGAAARARAIRAALEAAGIVVAPFGAWL